MQAHAKMRLPPLAVIESWPESNYTDPKTHGDALLIVNIIFITLVCIAVAGRLYSRIIIKQWYGADDTMIMLALVRLYRFAIPGMSI